MSLVVLKATFIAAWAVCHLMLFFKTYNLRVIYPFGRCYFLTITCGALSGFHATQTPLMARCAMNESEGRFIFLWCDDC